LCLLGIGKVITFSIVSVKMSLKHLTTAQVIRNADEIFHGIRWKYGIVVCPYCGSVHIKDYGKYDYRCRDCRKKFTDRTNTLMHGSKLSVAVWMQAIYEMMVDNFVSSIVLAKKLGINRKSAWLLQTKLRYSMAMDRWLLEGVIAQDEMYVGGSLSNYHYSRKWDLLRKGHYIAGDEKRYSKQALFQLNSDLKQPVFGMTNGDNVVLYATPNPIKSDYIKHVYRKHVSGDSVTVADESKLYNGWEREIGKIYLNNHHENQYVTKDGYTSNPIENKFSWYKRGFGGRITHCKYHQFYLNEYCFRYNTRTMTTEERFETLVGSTIGTRVTYKTIRKYKPYGEFKVKRNNNFTIEEIKHILSMGHVASLEQDGRVYTRTDMLNHLF